jgi:hypothetical protein
MPIDRNIPVISISLRLQLLQRQALENKVPEQLVGNKEFYHTYYLSLGRHLHQADFNQKEMLQIIEQYRKSIYGMILSLSSLLISSSNDLSFTS